MPREHGTDGLNAAAALDFAEAMADEASAAAAAAAAAAVGPFQNSGDGA